MGLLAAPPSWVSSIGSWSGLGWGVTYLGGDGRMIKDIVLLRQATKRSLNLERSMFRFSCVFSSSFPHSLARSCADGWHKILSASGRDLPPRIGKSNIWCRSIKLKRSPWPLNVQVSPAAKEICKFQIKRWGREVKTYIRIFAYTAEKEWR